MEHESINEFELNNMVEETIETGVIYLITNIENHKKYYGQAKSYRILKGKHVKHGHIHRFEEHKKFALKGKSDCGKLYNAIRKYGVEKFSCECILICKLENLNKYETYYINKDNTCKDGYNIQAEAKVSYDNGTRIEKISRTMKKKWKETEYINKTTEANLKAVIERSVVGKTRTVNDLPHNIYREKTDKYTLVVRIMRNKKLIIKYITDRTITFEQLIKKAEVVRDEILNGKNDDVIVNNDRYDHNNNILPKNILIYNNANYVGYRVAFRKNKKFYRKIFCNPNLSMDDKLKLAIQWLNENK